MKLYTLSKALKVQKVKYHNSLIQFQVLLPKKIPSVKKREAQIILHSLLLFPMHISYKSICNSHKWIMQMEQLCRWNNYIHICCKYLPFSHIRRQFERVQSSEISRFLVLENAHLINLSQH